MVGSDNSVSVARMAGAVVVVFIVVSLATQPRGLPNEIQSCIDFLQQCTDLPQLCSNLAQLCSIVLGRLHSGAPFSSIWFLWGDEHHYNDAALLLV